MSAHYYFVFAGDLTTSGYKNLVGSSPSKYAAIDLADAYCKENPGTRATVLHFIEAVESKHTVEIEKIFYAPEVPDEMPAPAPEPSSMYPNTAMPIAEEP